MNFKEEMMSGDLLGEAYRFERVVREDANSALLAVIDREGERVLLKVAPSDDPSAERQLAAWQIVRTLHHAHLLKLCDSARFMIAGQDSVCASFEYPDEILGLALGEESLGEAETRAIVEAAIDALQVLHAHGLIHGSVDADHFAAVDDSVKLIPDVVRQSETPEAQAEDWRQLAELARLLRAPGTPSDGIVNLIQRAPARTRPESTPTIEPEAPAVTRAVPADRRPAVFPKWIVAAVAIVLLAILAFNLRRPSQIPIVRTTIPPIAMPIIPATPAAQPVPGKWRVIAFTYRSADAAAKKVTQINRRWPDLHAGVFAPRERRGYYLVVLGDRMPREEAARLRHKARSLGLPRDVYVQNYEE